MPLFGYITEMKDEIDMRGGAISTIATGNRNADTLLEAYDDD